MAIPATREALRLGGNLNFGAGGLSIDFLVGTFVKSIVENEDTGAVTITYQDADGAPHTATLDGSLLLNAAPDADPQPVADAANFEARRLWWDGITLRHLVRTPGHGLQVNWPSYVSASYRGEHRDDPPNFENGENYYHLGAHRFVYRINGRNVGGSPGGWRGHVESEAAANARVSSNAQLFEWGDNVHVSSGYVAPTDDTFFWESLFREPHALANSEVDDDESDVQGTVSGKTFARGVGEHERFTEIEQEILDDLSRITFPHPTDDWQIRQTYSVRDFFADRYATFLSLGWDADNRLRALSGDGHVARLGGHDRGRIYDGSDRLRAGLISGAHWLFLRDDESHGGSNIERAPVDGGDSAVEFEINSIRYFSMFADPDSGELIGILRRISSTEMEVGLLAYDAALATITAEDSITLTRAHIDAALGADYSPLADIHRESAGGAYQDVAGAILEGDTLYLLLTDIRKTDGHTTSALVGFTLAGTPNNRTLTVLAENPVDEIPIADELTSGILPLEADELFIARDTAAYRLSPPVVSDIEASDVAVDTSNFSGKLAATDNTVQKVVDKVDDFVFAAGEGGNPEWTDVQNRPNRPTAAELLAGSSTDEAVPSVSDVVALVNNHRLVRSNADPANVGNVAEEGTEAEVARRDHTHRFPHDSTLEYDETNEQFGVSVHDVIEHLQESVEYYTGSPYDYSQGGGASEGEVYNTSDFHKRITRIRFRFLPVPGTRYEARILRVHDDSRIHTLLGTSQYRTLDTGGSHHFDFSGSGGEAGILVPGGTRIAIVLSRLGGGIVAANTGNESSNSPTESYDDASQDFVRQNSVVYDSENPAVDEHTHSHSNDIRGNIQISYTLTYNHGRFVGDNFELSDAVPQPNTTYGSAGNSEEAARADHSHPGSSGGGGEDIETLFDNRADTETALAVAANNSGGWAAAADVPLTRALVEADDVKDIRIKFRYTQNGLIRSIDELLGAEILRNFTENNSVTGAVYPAGGGHPFLIADGRAQNTSLSGSFTRMGVFARGQATTGEDVLRVIFNVVNNSVSAISEMRGTVELVPRLGGGAASSEQQLAGGTLATRTIVSGGTLLAANAFDFDVTSDGAFVAAGLGFAAVPLTNIFDFVATIRIGGRAGNPIRLSREQFNYVGRAEELVFGTWPFGGTGGGSWGNVTEIPCAMMYVDHVTDGVVKNALKPQRQQIGWTISGTETATAILIFFNYDAAEENLVTVRLVAFTDQVVEIESMHIHYWET